MKEYTMYITPGSNRIEIPNADVDLIASVAMKGVQIQAPDEEPQGGQKTLDIKTVQEIWNARHMKEKHFNLLSAVMTAGLDGYELTKAHQIAGVEPRAYSGFVAKIRNFAKELGLKQSDILQTVHRSKEPSLHFPGAYLPQIIRCLS